METSAYSARQRRAINQIWTACGDYRFEPQFLAMRSDGQPDLYMNCVIGLVHKWFGENLTKTLFAAWAGDARQAMYDDLAWLALENAVYEKELPERPALAGLRQAHAAAFFASEYQLSRQEWMAKNQLVYALQSARWKAVLGQKPPVLAPWEKGLSTALACPGTLSGEELTEAVRTAFRKYLRFDGTAHAKKPFTLHFGERWVPLLTKLFTTEMIRTDDLAIDRSAAAGENGMVRASNALRAQLESGDRENEDRDYVEGCFGRSLYPPRELALIEQRLCTGNHLGCHLWFTRGETAQGKTMRADVQHLFEQAAEQAKRNRADFLKNNDLYQSSILRLTEHIRNCMQVQQQPDAVSAPADRHLLILLTDASPDDSRKILPHRQGAAQPQLRRRGGRAGHRRGGSCFAAAGRPGRRRLYGRERQRPPTHGRSMDRIWSVSSGWISLPPLPENSFRRRFGSYPSEHVQVYCKSYHFSLQPT